MNAIITVNVNTLAVKDKELKSLCAQFEKAVSGQDTLTGTIAMTAYRMQQLFAGLERGQVIDNYKSYVDFMTRHYGVAKSQAFNLAKAGSMLTTVYDDKGKAKGVIDVFSEKAGSEKCFSNTAIVRFAEFINRKGNASAAAREEILIAMIKDGRLEQKMSIGQLTKVLTDYDKNLIETTASENEQSNQLDGTDNSDTDNSDTDNSGTDETPKNDNDTGTIQLVLGAKWALDLKFEMLRFTSTEEGLDHMCKLIEMINEKLK